MKTLQQLNNKGVHLAVKNGKGIISLCAEYGCTKDELKDKIGKIFALNTKESKKIMADLQRNDHRKKVLKKAYPSGITPSSAIDDMIRQAEREIRRSNSEASDSSPAEPTTSEIDKLKEQEAILSESAVKLETDYQSSLQKHAETLETLRVLSKRMDEIESELQSVMARYNNQAEQANNLVEEIRVKYDEKEAKARELNALREQISELNKVVICIYQDGEIELLEGDSSILDDSGFETVFNEMIKDRDNAHLRVVEIETLARLHQMIEHLDRKYELIFDDPSLEQAFSTKYN